MNPLVFVPTYNEAQNVERLCRELLDARPELDLLFLDDGSPDGTGTILDALAAREPRLTVRHRSGKLGIGSAHREGIRWARERGYTTLITMDGDFTHQPKYLRDLLRLGEQADLVIGSRHLGRDSLLGWDPVRIALTRVSHFLTRAVLGFSYDGTSAYRLYRLDRIPARALETTARNYSYFFESLQALQQSGVRIEEIPIDLPARTRGRSKMRIWDAFESARRLFTAALWRRLRAPERPAPASADWDRYWESARERRGLLFSLFGAAAGFYRAVVFRRALNRFLLETFPKGAELLHAGCGSGAVDRDAVGSMKITALDLSRPALALYERENGGRARTLQGDIRKLPLPDAAVDGVYNLGVMEHFTESEIVEILREFRRVLRPGGKIVLFWPPFFGPTVLLLAAVHFVLNRVLRRGIKLHPDEISRAGLPWSMRRLLAKGGFSLERYSFGPRDLFTHVVVVAGRAA
jgi:dolichol-phosphate mannosyltransferase